MHPLVEPVVPIELSQLVSRGRKLSPEIASFAAFLKGYIGEWAAETPFSARPYRSPR